MKTFAELFCARHGIPSDRYGQVVLWRCLYGRAKLLKPLFLLFNRDCFAADEDFVDGVGRLRRLADFKTEMKEFHCHPCNRGVWRRVFRVRISAGRLRKLVAAEFGEVDPDNGGSLPPVAPN